MDLSSNLKDTGHFDLMNRSFLDGYIPSGKVVNQNTTSSDGLVMDLQMRRQEKKLRLEEQLAKIKSQKTGESPVTAGSVSLMRS